MNSYQKTKQLQRDRGYCSAGILVLFPYVCGNEITLCANLIEEEKGGKLVCVDPGGKVQESDASPSTTASREFHEETGFLITEDVVKQFPKFLYKTHWGKPIHYLYVVYFNECLWTKQNFNDTMKIRKEISHVLSNDMRQSCLEAKDFIIAPLNNLFKALTRFERDFVDVDGNKRRLHNRMYDMMNHTDFTQLYNKIVRPWWITTIRSPYVEQEKIRKEIENLRITI